VKVTRGVHRLVIFGGGSFLLTALDRPSYTRWSDSLQAIADRHRVGGSAPTPPPSVLSPRVLPREMLDGSIWSAESDAGTADDPHDSSQASKRNPTPLSEPFELFDSAPWSSIAPALHSSGQAVGPSDHPTMPAVVSLVTPVAPFVPASARTRSASESVASGSLSGSKPLVLSASSPRGGLAAPRGLRFALPAPGGAPGFVRVPAEHVEAHVALLLEEQRTAGAAREQQVERLSAEKEELADRLLRLAAANEQVVAGTEQLERWEALSQARIRALEVSEANLLSKNARLEARAAELEAGLREAEKAGAAAVEEVARDLEARYTTMLKRQEEAGSTKLRGSDATPCPKRLPRRTCTGTVGPPADSAPLP